MSSQLKDMYNWHSKDECAACMNSNDCGVVPTGPNRVIKDCVDEGAGGMWGVVEYDDDDCKPKWGTWAKEVDNSATGEGHYWSQLDTKTTLAGVSWDDMAKECLTTHKDDGMCENPPPKGYYSYSNGQSYLNGPELGQVNFKDHKDFRPTWCCRSIRASGRTRAQLAKQAKNFATDRRYR
jgi:hypothetical protein